MVLDIIPVPNSWTPDDYHIICAAIGTSQFINCYHIHKFSQMKPLSIINELSSRAYTCHKNYSFDNEPISHDYCKKRKATFAP